MAWRNASLKCFSLPWDGERGLWVTGEPDSKQRITMSIQTNQVFQRPARSSADRLIGAVRGRRGYRLCDASCDEIEILLWVLR
jgi:hypothetical protein